MTKTQNYQLPQWEANDPVCREDFNQAMANIEAGITGASYVTGTYVGTGTSITIDLGFKPRFLIISGQIYNAALQSAIQCIGLIFGTNILSSAGLTDTGFRVNASDATAASGNFPKLNLSGRTYGYIAFR